MAQDLAGKVWKCCRVSGPQDLRSSADASTDSQACCVLLMQQLVPSGHFDWTRGITAAGVLTQRITPPQPWITPDAPLVRHAHTTQHKTGTEQITWDRKSGKKKQNKASCSFYKKKTLCLYGLWNSTVLLQQQHPTLFTHRFQKRIISYPRNQSN